MMMIMMMMYITMKRRTKRVRNHVRIVPTQESQDKEARARGRHYKNIYSKI